MDLNEIYNALKTRRKGVYKRVVGIIDKNGVVTGPVRFIGESYQKDIEEEGINVIYHKMVDNKEVIISQVIPYVDIIEVNKDKRLIKIESSFKDSKLTHIITEDGDLKSYFESYHRSLLGTDYVE